MNYEMTGRVVYRQLPSGLVISREEYLRRLAEWQRQYVEQTEEEDE